MKVGDVEITSCDEVLVLPRVGKDLVFKACAVDMDNFYKICPDPTAPNIRTRSGFGPDLDDDTYIEQVKHHNELRFAYLSVHALVPSGITWDVIDLEKPSTWLGWDKELREAGLSEVEMNRVMQCILSANSLDEVKLEKAREDFLRGQLQ